MSEINRDRYVSQLHANHIIIHSGIENGEIHNGNINIKESDSSSVFIHGNNTSLIFSDTLQSTSTLALREPTGSLSVFDIMTTETNRMSITHHSQSIEKIYDSVLINENWGRTIPENLNKSVILSKSVKIPASCSIILDPTETSHSNSIINIGAISHGTSGNIYASSELFKTEANYVPTMSTINIGAGTTVQESSSFINMGSFNTLAGRSNIVLGSQNRITHTSSDYNILIGSHQITNSFMKNSILVGRTEPTDDDIALSQSIIRINTDPYAPYLINASTRQENGTTDHVWPYGGHSTSFMFGSDIIVPSLLATWSSYGPLTTQSWVDLGDTTHNNKLMVFSEEPDTQARIAINTGGVSRLWFFDSM